MTDLSKLARKITWVLFANQSLASAGFIASATINSIIGAKLGGSASLAGVPSAIYLLGAAFAASAWGYIMDRTGRRNGMVAALVLGRFAAAEVNPPEKRGAAISNVVLGGTFGAVVGPLLVGPMGDLVRTFGLDELAGAYLATLVDRKSVV